MNKRKNELFLFIKKGENKKLITKVDNLMQKLKNRTLVTKGLLKKARCDIMFSWLKDFWKTEQLLTISKTTRFANIINCLFFITKSLI